MTALNKQALREAAEKATPGRIGDRIDGSGSIKYECHGYDGSLVLRADHKDMEYGFIGDNGNADELFFRLCVPDVILALLDEMEAANELNKHLELAIRKAEGCSEALRRKTEAAEKRIAEAYAGWGNCQMTMGVYCHAYEEAKNHIVDLNDQLQSVKKNASAWFKGMENSVRIGAGYEKRIAELEAREIKQAKGEVLVVVSGFTGCGKSAIAGEIEIAMKAIGVPVRWTNGDAEKRMTGADWLTAIEMYKPTVRIVEVNVPRAAGIGVKGE